MSNQIVPLLNAQQQGMSATITDVSTKQEVFAQVAQFVAAEVVAEENKKIDKAADDPEAALVSRDGGNKQNNSQENPQQRHEKDENVETCPSYHNPLAGKLFNAKV